MIDPAHAPLTPAEPPPPGEVYLVGGAVRDRLLERPHTERDWVVVGATPAAMQAAGFRPVGRDFPVFLQPGTGEEFALARTERKSGHGYTGFVFHAAPDVTLEQDLRRRDLTINAMAMDVTGTLIDPYGGAADLERRTLRHVSEHFVEDPLRVLRVARFAAQLAPWGFELADETLDLMRAIGISGELEHLTGERVWRELARALVSPDPAPFFQTLRDCGALARLLPELEALFGVPQPAHYHPEIDSGVHTLMALSQGARAGYGEVVQFAILCHDFGKAQTPDSVLPGHRGHEARGVPLVENFCTRLPVPKEHRALALAVTANHLNCHRVRHLRPATLMELFERMDAWRRPERVEAFAQACSADARGRTGRENDPYTQADYLQRAFAVARAVSARDLADQGFKGPALGEALRQARIDALARFKSEEEHQDDGAE